MNESPQLRSVEDLEGDRVTEPSPSRFVLEALFRRVLVPVDFSAGSRKAVEIAFDLRRKHGSHVHLFNVGSPSDGDDYLSGTGSHWTPNDHALEADAQVRRFVEHVMPGEHAFAVCAGDVGQDVASAIARAVRRCDASLLLLPASTHAHKPLFRTRAERIALAVDVPVLIVRSPDDPHVHHD